MAADFCRQQLSHVAPVFFASRAALDDVGLEAEHCGLDLAVMQDTTAFGLSHQPASSRPRSTANVQIRPALANLFSRLVSQAATPPPSCLTFPALTS